MNVGSYVRMVLATATQAKFTKGYKQQNIQEVFKTINTKKQYFVSWKGYDGSFNSWIESEAIYNLKNKK